MTALATLRNALASGATDPVDVAESCIAHANTNASRNTYLHFDPAALLAQARALPERFPDPATRPPLYGVPIPLKDCFDLAGTRTTCGSAFYAQRPPATHNSAVAQRLLDTGCLIPGKTHLHTLAYGITGQNRDFGDCLQPRDSNLLTGGSSSGAAASVQEGSALAAIGTDTGGSIRVPAALCGLAGYRASHSLSTHLWPGLWIGASHLAPSFDTLGLLCRDPRDLPLLAHALFRIHQPGTPCLAPETWVDRQELHSEPPPRIGCVPDTFLHDAEPEVLATYHAFRQALPPAADFDITPWSDTTEIFAGIQAHEAATLHRGHFHHFEPAIAQRLAWGDCLPTAEVAQLRTRHAAFRAQIAELFTRFDLLILPCAPVSRLRVDADQSAARQAILRYTTPFSLAGLPTVALPGEWIGAPFGTGVQLAAAPGHDAALLAFTASLAEQMLP